MEQLANGRSVEPAYGSGLVLNGIARRRKQLKIPARQVAEQMDGISLPIFSTIENGRVMPKKSDLKVMCSVLRCEPTDLYEADQLSLAEESTPLGTKAGMPPASTGRDHPGQVEFRTWLRMTERQTLRDTVKALGYRNEAEWFREMYRNTVARHRRLENGSSK